MGPKKCDTEEECLLRVEKCSPWGAPQELDGESQEEPEEHKRIKKGRPRGHRYGEKPGDKEYIIRPTS